MTYTVQETSSERLTGWIPYENVLSFGLKCFFPSRRMVKLRWRCHHEPLVSSLIGEFRIALPTSKTAIPFTYEPGRRELQV